LVSESRDRNIREQGDEDSLIRQAQEDPAAFGVLYERYVQQIYSYIYYRTSDRQEAEDLTSRTFHHALRYLPRYETRGAPFSSWLYRIAHNLIANWYRDRSQRQMIPLDELALRSDDYPPHRETVDEEREALLAAIRRLPADRQELLILKLSQGLSNAEIGQIMGRSEGAIKQLYYRTLRALRSDLESPRKEERP
jgi:RNA polymerase sigma-70 factor (ECF subfamily)